MKKEQLQQAFSELQEIVNGLQRVNDEQQKYIGNLLNINCETKMMYDASSSEVQKLNTANETLWFKNAHLKKDIDTLNGDIKIAYEEWEKYKDLYEAEKNKSWWTKLWE